LRAAVHAWSDWLSTEISVETWFPSIDVNVTLVLRRRDFVQICGNTSKHNVTRLTRKAKSLAKLFECAGVKVDELDSSPALDDLHQRFHLYVLVYHSTTIAELLNNVRWAIHDYIKPVYQGAYVPPASENSPFYSFHVPN